MTKGGTRPAGAGSGGTGLALAVLSAATFGTSGTFASSLIGTGWSPAAAVLARIAMSALILTIPAVLRLRGRWAMLRRGAGTVVGYGLVAVAGCQLFYFNAIQRMPVGVALLLEYLGTVLVVGWLWLRYGQRPRRLTVLGAVAAVAGLAMVLNLAGSAGINPVGVMWGLLAAVGLAVYFVLSATAGAEPLPPIVMAWAGMCVGAAALAVLGWTGALPMHATTRNVDFLGHRVSWVVPVLGLSILAAVIAYVAGIGAARRLGARLASFIGLAEVLFAVLFAWALLGQLPSPVQFAGGAFILAGVTLVRADELRSGRVGVVDKFEQGVSLITRIRVNPSRSAPRTPAGTYPALEGCVMLQQLRSPRFLARLVAAGGGLALVSVPAVAMASPAHDQMPPRDLKLNQVNLASDLPGMAPVTDPDLKNPWGISFSATSPLWISNQGTDSSTLYTLPPGSNTATKVPTVRVTMPDSVAGPSGQVSNPGPGFVLSNGTASAPAAFIFATLDGHIEAWSPKVDPLIGNAEDKVTVPGAGYTGLAIAPANGGELFAANFAQGRVDVFDSAFKPVKTARWQFSDPRLPRGYLPFNTQAVGGNIFVTYDKADPATGREAVGAGLGVVDEYTTDGHLIARIASHGPLNAPWGVAIAPASWGSAAGSLLVGNFGDGRINIIAKHGDHFADEVTGQVRVASTGKPFAEPGLWGLLPGTATTGGTDALWFTAGINHEQNGLLGVLRP